ncbi:hypothetical protein Pan241w_48870 [Gimesia alba]|uniref:Uncharacterized protein n=1 Tax=Gimesia alba TaxID=2527973 RepID=A0A517RLL7_9PLAN|nr:hypothetical protein Pan241w_48870 [Gimesia alba]
MIYPTDLELLEFFEIEPNREGDVLTYYSKDSSGMTLTFSFNPYDGSVQTILKFEGRVISLVCHEGLTRMWIEDTTLRAEFERDDYRTNMSIVQSPFLQVEWSGIRTL